MISELLMFLASPALAFWGGMHIAKERPVVAGCEPLSDDDRSPRAGGHPVLTPGTFCGSRPEGSRASLP